MKLIKYLAPVVVGLLAVGCAAESSDEPMTQDDGAAEQDVTGQKKFHYDPIAPSVTWKPGCGQQPPDGRVCENGLFLTFTRKYIDLKVDKKVTVDDAKSTITVKLDTWSTSNTHPMTFVALSPQTERLETNGTNPSKTYTVKVVNWQDKVLSTTQIRMIFAP